MIPASTSFLIISRIGKSWAFAPSKLAASAASVSCAAAYFAKPGRAALPAGATCWLNLRMFIPPATAPWMMPALSSSKVWFCESEAYRRSRDSVPLSSPESVQSGGRQFMQDFPRQRCLTKGYRAYRIGLQCSGECLLRATPRADSTLAGLWPASLLRWAG